MLTSVLLLTGMALAVAGFHGLIRWSLRAPRVIERETPETFGLAFEEVHIPGANDKSLFGWLIPSVVGESAPALVVMHGWGGNAETMLPLASPLHRAGFALLLIDARNHGRSDADTFSSLPRFAEDIDRALDWLQIRHSAKPVRLGVVGHSVGAAAALLAASRRRDLAAVVSIAAFAHPAGVMRRLLKAWHIPYLPFGWYVLGYVQRVIGYRLDDIAPLNTIAHVRCPVLLVQGTEDVTVPMAEAELLHARRGSGTGGLLLVKGSHDSYDELDKQIGDVIDFLDTALKPENQRIVQAIEQAANMPA